MRPAAPPHTGVIAGWIHGPAPDLLLIVGVTLLALAMGGTAARFPPLFLPLLTAHIWLFGFDHVVATFTKLAGLPEDRRRYRFLIRGLPPIVLLATLALGLLGGLAVLNGVYFLFQVFHTTRQSWGILQHYRRAAGGLPVDDPRLSELVLWSVPLWGALHRCQQAPAQFLYMDIRLPPCPPALVALAGAFAAALVLHWALTRARAAWRGELALGHTLFMAAHLLIFLIGYVVIDDVQAGWLVANVWHNVQYLVYVYLHNRQRFAGGVRPDARVLSWLSQPGVVRTAGYFLVCLLISTPLYALLFRLTDRLDLWLDGRVLSLGIVASLTVNFHHYIVDGVIWRRRAPASAAVPSAP